MGLAKTVQEPMIMAATVAGPKIEITNQSLLFLDIVYRTVPLGSQCRIEIKTS